MTSEIKTPDQLNKTECEDRIRIMDEFLEHPGWLIYKNYFERVEQANHETAVFGKTSEERTEHAIYVRLCRLMRAWPLAHSKSLKEALELEAKEPGSIWIK